MSNILLEDLPTMWKEYQVNTWFQIGIQIQLLFDDDSVDDREKGMTMLYLLFGNEDGSMRAYPQKEEELEECIRWFMNGWCLDKTPKQEKEEKIMDYDVDQGRIYADFLQIYGINLQKSDMHWWEFCWLLWNMPQDRSSFHQVIEIRTKKPRKGASAEERKAIEKGRQIYGLGNKKTKKAYTSEEKAKIDAYDRMMSEKKKKKAIEEMAVKEFHKM